MSNAEELGPGVRVGDFLLARKLGEGGFGGVWLAHGIHEPRVPVALKLGWESEAGRKAGGRGRRELRVLLELDHPHIVRPLAYGLWPARPGGRPYLVMEYVEGEALDAWVRRANPSLEVLGTVFGKLLSALAHAHSRGVLHRDLKPGNVWVDAATQPTLLDWGAGDAVGALTLTERGLPPGTPGYRSPQAECFAGPGAYACTPLDDLYALGVTFYVALTEVHPFPFESREQLSLAVAHVRPVAAHALNPRVPEVLGTWVSRLMASRVEERFFSASDALDALRAVLTTPGGDWGTRVYEHQAPKPHREAPTQPPTTGDGPPAEDVEVLAHHALSASWARDVDERHEAAVARRDALLAVAAARAEVVAVPARNEVPPAIPEAGPPVPKRPRVRVARGWGWVLGGLLVLTVGVGLRWIGWEIPRADSVARQPSPTTKPVAPSRLESAQPEAVVPATLTPASSLPLPLPAKEGLSVNPSPLLAPTASAPTSRRSRLVARAAQCVVGATLAATQAACPGIPLRPAEEKCPLGAFQTIKDLGLPSDETLAIWLDASLPHHMRKGLYREGPLTSEVISPLAIRHALISGQVIFGGNGRMFVRYTAITPRGGRTMPFCAQLGDSFDAGGVGLPMDDGSTPQAIKMGSRGTGYLVDHFY
ncbi:serine/threonine-protein kinase [Myxococcus sp. RHSTA-1-4]|uniref:serine/threonine protein kinase n=1 Tax=Myxococcus sp. RHSTA-1-4 TaxID=2874601 RepID=UPI001CBEB73B|nr:serine/threonine-protein kinase [Myxococcus sp. RHSTA-1-4]MBZ4416000.1 protein kinase [Myxococcus sp. RHSTA-1-4]